MDRKWLVWLSTSYHFPFSFSFHVATSSLLPNAHGYLSASFCIHQRWSTEARKKINCFAKNTKLNMTYWKAFTMHLYMQIYALGQRLIVNLSFQLLCRNVHVIAFYLMNTSHYYRYNLVIIKSPAEARHTKAFQSYFKSLHLIRFENTGPFQFEGKPPYENINQFGGGGKTKL